MTTALESVRFAGMARKVFAAGAAAAVIYYLVTSAIPYFQVEESVYGPYWSRRGILLVHVIGGIVALTVGGFQVWSGLGGWWKSVHRWLGRLYVIGVCVAGGGALILSIGAVNGPGFGVAMLALTVVWLFSTGMALALIRRGRVASHRQWVSRSYVLTCAFVTIRLLYDSRLLATFGPWETIAIGWLCWTVPLAVTELLILRGRALTNTERSIRLV